MDPRIHRYVKIREFDAAFDSCLQVIFGACSGDAVKLRGQRVESNDCAQASNKPTITMDATIHFRTAE
jgi:hypothetical protein